MGGEIGEDIDGKTDIETGGKMGVKRALNVGISMFPKGGEIGHWGNLCKIMLS